MEILRDLVNTYGACATRTMLDEVISQVQQDLKTRMEDINLYLSGKVEEGAIATILNKAASVEEHVKETKSAKAEQRAAEAAKRAELQAAGVAPRDQLTKENLQRWLGEGKTFSQIAREEVGLRQEEVSAAAKKFGLKAPRKTEKETPTVKITKEA
jgi:hypothetical protein